MNTSTKKSKTLEKDATHARRVSVDERVLTVELADGRSISAPLEWYPRLAHATPAERDNWTSIGRGDGIHWPDLDEHISVENLLQGSRSGESARSFERWLASRVKSR